MYVQNSKVLTKIPNLISTIPSVPEELKEVDTPYGNKVTIYNFAYFFSNPLILPFKITFDAIIYGNISIGSQTVNEKTISLVTITNEDKLSISGNGVVILWYRYNNNIPLFDSVINYAIQQRDYVLTDALIHTLSISEAIKFILDHPCIQNEFAKGLDWQLSKIGFNEFLKYINNEPYNPRDLAFFLTISSFLFPRILNEYNIPIYSGKVTDVYAKYLELLGYPITSEIEELSEQLTATQNVVNALIGITALQGSEIESLSEQIVSLSESCIECSENLSELEIQTTNEFDYLKIRIKLLQSTIQQLAQIVEQLISQQSEQQFEFYFNTLDNVQNLLTVAQLVTQHYKHHEGITLARPHLYDWAYQVLVNLVNSNFSNILPASNNYPEYTQETQILQEYLDKSVQCFAKAFIQYLQSEAKNIIGQPVAQNVLVLFSLVVEGLTLYGCYQVRSQNNSEYLEGLQAYVTQGLYYALGVKESLAQNGVIQSNLVNVQSAIIESACNHDWTTFNASKISQEYPCYSTQVTEIYNSYQFFKNIANSWLSSFESVEPLIDQNLYDAVELLIGTLMEYAYALAELGYPPACPNQQNVQTANNTLSGLIGLVLNTVINIVSTILSSILNLLNGLLNSLL
ncbi:hypothetical protein [Acidianus bottle-shaped virus 3 strain ABV3]|uniref:Uncharacterized protein n=1 Tax=Acidianus bottle-shaped virus 3 strain ABV3 TaxID=1732174 RepID=A0A0N9PB26_9VIRU|nr:hypothetical protein AVU00_gp63 [Acidianus bottle-shaped virus 3 strain ABV3]ALG96865.1 hypothetical protein [Acidianus bottle-shaped virus 3 strain ABV3]